VAGVDASALASDGSREEDVVEDALVSVSDGHGEGADSLGAVAVDLGKDLPAGDKDKVLGREALLQTRDEHGLDLVVLVALAEGNSDDHKLLLGIGSLQLSRLKDAQRTDEVLDLLGCRNRNVVDGSSNELLNNIGILLATEDEVSRVLHKSGHVVCVTNTKKRQKNKQK